jgi:hypothetical protein
MEEPVLYQLVREGRLCGDAARRLTEAVFAALEAELGQREDLVAELRQALRRARAASPEQEDRRAG